MGLLRGAATSRCGCSKKETSRTALCNAINVKKESQDVSISTNRTGKSLLVGFLVAAGLVSVPWNNAYAQADIAAQEFQRQQERERVLRQQQEKTPDVRLERPKLEAEKGLLPTDESPCFKIDSIVLVGDAAEKFQWALVEANQTEDGQPDPAVQRCLGMRGINQVMRRMQNAIVKRG